MHSNDDRCQIEKVHNIHYTVLLKKKNIKIGYYLVSAVNGYGSNNAYPGSERYTNRRNTDN